MTRLATAFAATIIASLRWLKPRAVTRGWSGGVARAAADPFPQLGQLARQGGELEPQLLDLLMLGQDEGLNRSWSRQPVRFLNPGRRGAHPMRSLPEIQLGIKMPSRVQRGPV